jgi:tellurite methyltransferase
MTVDHSPLLPLYQRQLALAASNGAILDLACGGGRNGLYLIGQGIPVVFGDVNPVALEQVQQRLMAECRKGAEPLATLWPVDFEQGQDAPFQGRTFGGMMVFRYLHRPLMQSIKQAVVPGGIVIYETFTVDHPQFGRPHNPDFLLGHGELQEHFADWNILHSFEGVVKADGGNGARAIAQIVAIKAP